MTTSEVRQAGVKQGSVKLGAIDLNLLVVFDAVMREGSVTRAGRRLGLSQPAMSHALARLRHMMKDDLVIRSPRGMVPTPWAEQLALPVREAIETLQRSFEPSRFEPATDGRHFRIAADNYASFVLAGPLAACMAKQAPNIVPEDLAERHARRRRCARPRAARPGDRLVRRAPGALFLPAVAA